MKKIINFSVLLAGLLMIGLTGCTQEELSTDQYNDGSIVLSAFGPNPVMRGATLTILGSNLDKVTEVRLPGIDPISTFDEVVAGRYGSIKLTVPVQAPDDAPAAGVVTIVDKNGKESSSTTELTFTEAFVIDSFSPAEALPGDVVTVKGDYLYNVKEIALSKGADAKTYALDLKVTREQLTFVVPNDATTGKIMISDVDHNNNPDGILPNEIYSEEELTIKDPTVVPFEATAFKRGETVTVSGAYLGMIEKVVFVGEEVTEFTVAEDGKTITLPLPDKATDGAVTVVSYAGKEFAAGEITTVVPTGLAVAAETRYKAGLNAVISGSDLDLVTGVSFAGEWSESFVYANDKVTAVIPATAGDGDVVVALANGKSVSVGAIEVVKPVISELTKTTVVAGVDSLNVKGTDLDLVTKVAIAEHECEFVLDTLEDKSVEVKVYVNRLAYTSDLVVTAANGSTSSAPVEITYDESVSIEYVKSSISLGGELRLTGVNINQIEAISIAGNKVYNYTKRTDEEIAFVLPEEIVSPGFFTLDLTLMSGETLTWPVPFEVTASFVLVPIWEGSFNVAGWEGNQDLAWGGYDWSSLAPGTTVQFTCVPNDPSAGWWCLSLRHALSWGYIPALPGQYDNPTVLEVVFTQEVIDDLVANNGLVFTGDGCTVTQIALKVAQATETVLWEGEAIADDWNIQPYLLSDAGVELADAGAQAGQTVYFYFEPLSADWKVEIVEGHWGPVYMSVCAAGQDPGDGTFTENGKFTEYDLDANGGKIGLTLTPEILTAAFTQGWWGGTFVLNGDNVKCTKVTLL